MIEPTAPVEEAREAFLGIVGKLSEAIPPKKREEVAASVLGEAAALAEWFKQGHAAMPRNLDGHLNFIGPHSTNFVNLTDANDLGVIATWPCGCIIRVGPLCPAAVDHRKDAKYQLEKADERRKKNLADLARTSTTASQATLTVPPKETA